jgi:hypothetical protein
MFYGIFNGDSVWGDFVCYGMLYGIFNGDNVWGDFVCHGMFSI